MAQGTDCKMPPMTWLQMPDYTHAWLERELGGSLRAHDKRLLSTQHIEGVKAILRMETVEDMMEKKTLGSALSCTRMRCFEAGLKIDPETMESHYGVTEEVLKKFVPIECPKLCLTSNGVLRPWTLDVTFGRSQAYALQKVLKSEFWRAVGLFDREFAEQGGSNVYPTIEMIEAFCDETGTPDLYAEALRREWQRRENRKKIR